MNDLLKNMTEVGDVAAFIDDDIIIRTETEEEYDDIIEEILKRMVENNFFVKSEKYM